MGGMTSTARTNTSSAKVPQWSPPVMGGMTCGTHVPFWAAATAAMEPARNGRDDGLRSAGGATVSLAAMEPARNGRDDSLDAGASQLMVSAAMEPARNGRDDRDVLEIPETGSI